MIFTMSQSFHNISTLQMIHVCLILKTISKINKSLKKELKELPFLLNGNKISLSDEKLSLR